MIQQQISPNLERLIKDSPKELFGMRPDAAWDSILLMDTEEWTLDVMIAYHYGCFFGQFDPNREPPKREEVPQRKEGWRKRLLRFLLMAFFRSK